MNFTEKITGIINNPKETMKSIAQEPLIEEAVMIVGIYAIIAAIAAYVQSYKIKTVFENIPPSIDPAQLAGSTNITNTILYTLIFAFLFWLIGSGLIHFISKALGGEGKFYPQLITASGYSMIPQMFGSIISLALYLNMDTVTVTMDMANPFAGNNMMNTPFFFEIQIISGIMMLWGGIIFVYGVQSVHKLDLKKSAIAVGIPLSISIIFFILSIWISSKL